MSTALLTEASASAGKGYGNQRAWIPIAFVLCFAYGILLISLIHTTADGSWFWYASALGDCQHLYRDLHLPLQPLYPIELLMLQRLFGISWIAQQAVGVVNLLIFLLALSAVIRKIDFAGWQRALLFCGTFVTCMAFIMMRFDDFHVVATSMELFAVSLLLGLAREVPGRNKVGTYLALGAICGSCLLVRLNDGGLLLGTVTFVAVCNVSTTRERLKCSLAIPGAAAVLILSVITAIGETPHDWWFYSVHAAAAIKGGSGHLWVYPLRLPGGTLRELTRDWRTLALTLYALVIGAVAWTLTTKTSALRHRRLLIALAVLPAIPLARNIARGNAARILVAFTVFAIYAAAMLVLVRWYRALRRRAAPTWNPTELILLIPLAQLVSVSLSAARWYPNTNPPAALMIMLLPVGLPWAFRRRQVRAVFFSWIALLTLSAGIDKARNPFDWFNYKARSLEASRVWFQHPAFGPMLIETQHLSLMLPVCSAINETPPDRRELLSLPFTYANYFCNIRPWHGYVQTFYDLSSRETIRGLEGDLLARPPEWILYQRQLDVLSRNEEAFNEGRPLPHRELDHLIMEKLSTRDWEAKPLPSPGGDTSSWLLIHTRPSSNDRQIALHGK